MLEGPTTIVVDTTVPRFRTPKEFIGSRSTRPRTTSRQCPKGRRCRPKDVQPGHTDAPALGPRWQLRSVPGGRGARAGVQAALRHRGGSSVARTSVRRAAGTPYRQRSSTPSASTLPPGAHASPTQLATRELCGQHCPIATSCRAFILGPPNSVGGPSVDQNNSNNVGISGHVRGRSATPRSPPQHGEPDIVSFPSWSPCINIPLIYPQYFAMLRHRGIARGSSQNTRPPCQHNSTWHRRREG